MRPSPPAPHAAPARRDDSPHAEYTRRLEARSTLAARRTRRAAWISNARLAVFLLGLLLAWAALGAERVPARWLWVPVSVFVALVVAHDRALRARQRAERSAAWYEAGLARLEDRFAGRGETGTHLRPPDHLYAEDLDLFGEGSLFELLCRARTRAGEARLADWLLAPAGAREIRERQAAVAELRDRLDFREALALVGEAVGARLHPAELTAWGRQAPPPPGAALRALAAAWAALVAGLLAAWVPGALGSGPLLAALAAQALLALRLRKRTRRALREVEQPARDLVLLSELLELLEHEALEAPRLAALRAAVETAGRPASRCIARLRLLVELLDARRNQLFALIGPLFLFTTQVALAVDAWRARHGPSLAAWLDAVAELEALASLAAQAWEHPDDPFPEIDEDAPRFQAEALGHTLLAEAACVRNDLRLDGDLRVLVVSGSNMSGKSTLLRSVGVATVLALAGAPVRAGRLRISPLQLGASIRVHDSLREGSSRFYAEIQRLKRVVERTAEPPPVLFLLDEILHGTNSHDRRIGAEAVVRSLVARGAVGLVTTHDLALARVADALAPRAANVHFEDRLEEGRVVFDYALRPGVVTRSNALDLMRAIGLEV